MTKNCRTKKKKKKKGRVSKSLSQARKKSEDRLTEEQIDALDDIPEWREAKRKWKEEHPNHKIKNYKAMYSKGIISKLSWEAYSDPIPMRAHKVADIYKTQNKTTTYQFGIG